MSRSSTRTATTLVVVLVLLVGVVAALLGSGGRSGSAPTSTAPPRTSASEPRSSSTATSRSTLDPETGLRVVALSSLPRQARETVALIDAGGPFPYAQDGATFGNNERHLPTHPRGYYREYTVKTPGEGDRGPRRIVTGDADRELFYTADHYDSFVRVSR